MQISDAVVGTWQLAMRTPIGTMSAELTFVSTHHGLSGTATGKDETVPLTDIRVEPAAAGHRVLWRQQITRPLRLNLEFDVLVDGDTLSGTSRAGRLPRSDVSGTRAAEPR